MSIKPLITALLLGLSATMLGNACATPSQHKPAKASKAAAHKKKPAKKKAPAVDYEGEYVNFGDWKEVSSFLDEVAARNHWDRAELNTLMAQVRFVDSAVQLIKPAPPGKPKNWQAYSKLFIEPVRINAGLKFWAENSAALERAENLYGVPAEVIVGIIGVETVYGRNTGRFRVLDALTTLAFAYPEAPARTERMAFFRRELEAALQFARKNHLDPLSLRGSFAGAIGMPQFMPNSVMKFAVDFDGDGQIDLLNSPTDAIGSVAAFLVAHGWQRELNGAMVYPATVAPHLQWERMLNQGLVASYSWNELKAAGISTETTPPEITKYGLVDLQNGAEPTEYWLANGNFFAITQYNRSYFYAMSVLELGRAIKQLR
ncbi:lytic murein transglycosylase B [Pseudoduganella danionis]|uniref:lytic murein transglycosylase B n=1 Tax=Pseudoduganella danionis TaxID=1890295 RepID=UPI0035B057C4